MKYRYHFTIELNNGEVVEQDRMEHSFGQALFDMMKGSPAEISKETVKAFGRREEYNGTQATLWLEGSKLQRAFEEALDVAKFESWEIQDIIERLQ